MRLRWSSTYLLNKIAAFCSLIIAQGILGFLLQFDGIIIGFAKDFELYGIKSWVWFDIQELFMWNNLYLLHLNGPKFWSQCKISQRHCCNIIFQFFSHISLLKIIIISLTKQSKYVLNKLLTLAVICWRDSFKNLHQMSLRRGHPQALNQIKAICCLLTLNISF